MSKVSLFFMITLLITSCSNENDQEVLDRHLHEGNPQEALKIVSLSECDEKSELCGILGAGLLRFEPYIERAKEYIEASAKAGFPRAQASFGTMLIEGNYFEQDIGRGIDLFRAAADSGASEGMFYLANEYYFGNNIPKNYEKALELYINAASLGHKYAPFNTAILHYELFEDCDVAEKYFKQSEPFMIEAKEALIELRTKGPCAKVL